MSSSCQSNTIFENYQKVTSTRGYRNLYICRCSSFIPSFFVKWYDDSFWWVLRHCGSKMMSWWQADDFYDNAISWKGNLDSLIRRIKVCRFCSRDGKKLRRDWWLRLNSRKLPSSASSSEREKNATEVIDRSLLKWLKRKIFSVALSINFQLCIKESMYM